MRLFQSHDLVDDEVVVDFFVKLGQVRLFRALLFLENTQILDLVAFVVKVDCEEVVFWEGTGKGVQNESVQVATVKVCQLVE